MTDHPNRNRYRPTHRTASGCVTLMDSWGHGRAPRASWDRRPATLISDDDGHFDAWAVDGSIRDAADVVAQFVQRGGNIVSLYGSTVRAETAPADFWIEDEARGVVPNLAAYPNVVAF